MGLHSNMNNIDFAKLWELLSAEVQGENRPSYSSSPHLFKDMVVTVYESNESQSAKQTKKVLDKTEIW